MSTCDQLQSELARLENIRRHVVDPSSIDELISQVEDQLRKSSCPGWVRPRLTNVAPGASSAGKTGVTVATSTDGRIFYNWWELGGAAKGWRELDGDGRTDAAPAAALIGEDGYLFVIVKGLDGNLYINQGNLGKPFVGWQSMGFD